MKTVEQILDEKGREVWTVGVDDTVYSALELMAEKNVGAVLVVDGEQPVGILSERDYARKVVLEERVSRSTAVSEIMTPNPVGIRPGQTVEECMVLITARRIRHLPVIDEGKLVGMLSIGDVVKAMISEREFMIRQLENYIAGQ
jgi:CBS domain-containing protein